jgi:hypothetical protein
VPVEQFHHPRKIQKRSAEPVHFVHDDAIDGAAADVSDQPLECRSLHVPTGKAAVVVRRGQQLPSLVPLAADEGFGGLSLSIEGVELLVKALLD